MGFKGSVVLAQGLQDGFTRGAGFPEHSRLSPLLPAPARLPTWGSIMDDVWGMGREQGFPLLRQWFSQSDAEA